MNLRQKQDYYEYGPGGSWSYKQAPRLDASLSRELARFSGTDLFGDPIYRFLWAGVRVIAGANNEQDLHPTIIGDAAATKVSNGRVQPKYLHGWQKEDRWICYRDKSGSEGRVKRPEDLPVDTELSWEEFRPTAYGKLRWIVERKLSAEQLVEALIYPEDDPRIPAKGGYIWALTVETPDGRYYEPDRYWLQAIQEHVRELETESMKDLLEKDRAVRAAVEKERELQPEKEMEKSGDDVGFFASQLHRFNKNAPKLQRIEELL